MHLDFVSSFSQASERTKNRIVLIALTAITILRSFTLVITPLELGVDEAQYWLWSQSPDTGYFTKPPLIAWIIGVSHWIFGHYTWAVRLPACWINFFTALLLWRSATWLYGEQAGRIAAIIWITLPAIGLGSFLISTDTPLLALWSLGLLSICGIATQKISQTSGVMLAGFAFGLAMLAKYAAIYALFSAVLIIFSSYLTYQKLFHWRHFLLMCVGFVLASSPNIFWNFTNEFWAIRHLGENANLSRFDNDFADSLRFFGSQFFVAGPLIFTLMIFSAFAKWREPQTIWLICMSAPILFLMIVQAFNSEANANWAMTAFPALTLLVAGWLGNFKRKYIWLVAICVNVILSIFISAVTISGSMGSITPESDPLRRLRGWQQLSADILPHLKAHNATAIIADRRATAALLSWHFHSKNISILIHDSDSIPSNHFESMHAWSSQPGRHVIAITGDNSPPEIGGINWLPKGTSKAVISKKSKRHLKIFYGIE